MIIKAYCDEHYCTALRFYLVYQAKVISNKKERNLEDMACMTCGKKGLPVVFNTLDVKDYYRWTLSANSLIHIQNIGLKQQIPRQNVSFYMRIQYSRSKIVERIYHK
jgi:hypothetical protein